MIAQMMPGMQFIPLILLAIVVATLAGLLSILLALLRHKPSAKLIAWFCIIVSLFSTLMFLLLIKASLGVSVYLIIASPTGLGCIALGINHVYADLDPLKGYQIPFTVILYFMAVVACGLGLYKATHVPYYGRRDKFQSYIETIPGINNVSVKGRDRKGYYNIDEIEFSIKDLPNSLVRISPSNQLLGPKDQIIEKLHVIQIGPWEFHEIGEFTLKPSIEDETPTPYTRIGINLGVEGEHSILLITKVNSVNDLRDKYVELVKEFQKWPTKANPKKRTRSSAYHDYTFDYYCTFDPRYQLESDK